jgi:GntR family transcriptional regulator
MENILRERWKPGDRVPSTRELAIDVEVNPNTVIKTYALLQEQGIIVNQRGRGYFVAKDGLNGTRRLKMKEFVEQDLPDLFKTMELLELDAGDLEAHWTKHRIGQGAKNENKQQGAVGHLRCNCPWHFHHRGYCPVVALIQVILTSRPFSAEA